jgi:tetratricopeptide (TPR) repeat protein
MWKPIKYTLMVLAGLPSILGLFFLENWLAGKPLPNLPRLLSFFHEDWLLLVAASAGFALSALYAHQRDVLKTLRAKGYIYKRTEHLQASDIEPSPAWYDSYFISRSAVDEAATHLISNQSVLLLGVPLIGKTRCAFEALKVLKGHHVLVLSTNDKAEEINLPRDWIVLKPKLIVFLDNINRFVGRFTPSAFLNRLAGQSGSLTVLATCRSRKEYTSPPGDHTFGQFIDSYFRKVNVEELTWDQEKDLADHFGRDWDPAKYDGTPGAIVLGPDRMRDRLEQATADAKTLMRSLSLMRAAGLDELRLPLAEQISSNIYESKAVRPELESAWLWLKEEHFLAIDKQRDVVSPTHAVYLEQHFYRENTVRNPEPDQEELWRLVSKSENTDDIRSMALSASKQNNPLLAETRYRRYLEIKPTSAIAHYEFAIILDKLGRHEEAQIHRRKALGTGLSALRHLALNTELTSTDFMEAMTLLTQAQAEAYKQQMEKWRKLQATQALVNETMNRVTTARADIQKRAAEKWLAFLAGIESPQKEHREAIGTSPDHAPAQNNPEALPANQVRQEESPTHPEAPGVNPDDSFPQEAEPGSEY